jgi:phage-related minor tail protein
MRPRPKVETVPEEGADPGVEDLLQTGRASVELLAELSAKLERAQEELRRRTAPEVGASNSVFQMLTTELADLERRIAAILEERAAIREEAFGGPAVQPLEVAPSEILRLAELNLRQAQEVQRLALDVMLEALRLLREMQQGTARLAEENRREPLGRIPEARDETMPLLQETLRELMRWLRQNAVTAVQEQCCEEQRSQLRSPRSDALGNRDLFVRGPVPLGRAIQQGEAATRSFAEGARAALEDYADTAASVGAQVEGIFTTSFRGMEDALVAFVRTGKLEFGSLVDAILADLTRILVRRAILGPLSQAFAGLLGGGVGLGPQFTGADIGAQGSFAHGAVFGSGVVTRPTLFPMANGIGLMGEAGPEAVLPLKRLPGGDLGVRAQGGGGVVNNITVVNEAGAEVETSERRNPTGGVDSVIRLFKRDMQREIEQGGPLARSILSLTGASQAAVRR